jgi:dienelactone hydrolase
MPNRCILSSILALLVLVSFGTALSAERVVDLKASDGIALKATYFAAAKPGPGVLLLHQCNRQRKVWDSLAQQLASSGINVLTLDLRGYGESGGPRFVDLPPDKAQAEREHWPSDIDVAFQFLQSQPGVERDMIGAGGASCGVQNSVQLALRHPEVKSLVLLSGTTNLAGRQYLRNSPNLPILYAVADDDEFPPTVQTIEWLYTLTPNPGKKFVHYTKGGHGSDMFAANPELPGLIVDWYVTTLLKTPGHAPVAKEAPAIPQDVQNLNTIDEPGGATKVRQQLAEARAHDPNAKFFPEDVVNSIGYEHLQSGDRKSAIDILKLNAEAFPNSPNVYDSLSDAYLADGQKDLARENAKKALDLLASDTTDNEQRRNGIKDSAEQKLKQLGEAGK